MTAAHATFTVTVPWWAYGAFCAGVLGLIAAGYVAGRADGRDARKAVAVEEEFAPTLNRWRDLDRDHVAVEGAAAWPVNPAEPTWAVVLEAWGQPRTAAGYPPPPALTAEPDPRVAEPTVGRAAVTGEPLDWPEQVSAINVALGGRVHWAATAEETGLIPAVRA